MLLTMCSLHHRSTIFDSNESLNTQSSSQSFGGAVYTFGSSETYFCP
jgi:hypothetical protein